MKGRTEDIDFSGVYPDQLEDYVGNVPGLDAQTAIDLRRSSSFSAVSRQSLEAHDLETGIYKKRFSAITALDTVNVGLGLGLKEHLLTFFTGIVETILFPISAGFSLIRAVAATVVAYQQKSQNAVIRAVVEWGTAGLLSVAVAGMFVGSIALVAVAPFLIVAAYAVKSLYHLGASIFYGIKSLFLAEKLPFEKENKQVCVQKAKSHGVLAFASLIVTGLAVAALLINKLSLGWLGIAGGALAVGAVGVASYNRATLPKQEIKAASNVEQLAAPLLAESSLTNNNPTLKSSQSCQSFKRFQRNAALGSRLSASLDDKTTPHIEQLTAPLLAESSIINNPALSSRPNLEALKGSNSCPALKEIEQNTALAGSRSCASLDTIDETPLSYEPVSLMPDSIPVTSPMLVPQSHSTAVAGLFYDSLENGGNGVKPVSPPPPVLGWAAWTLAPPVAPPIQTNTEELTNFRLDC